MKEISTRYDHTKEPEIYKGWEESGAFQPAGKGEPFSMIMPPPNVTGDLHMGHALTYAIHDCLARHQRRLGKQVMILPGADHAAIAVQALVEKKISKELGVSRTQLGREKFLEEVHKWIDYYMPRMNESQKRFGVSCDWSRFRYTMDEHSQLAVRTAFVELYNRGLIYRGEYMINWDPKLQTAISDDEVLYQDAPGKLYWIKYGPITLATTRPETKFGDTAIAVNPKDERYKKYVGTEIEVTFVTGEKRKVPVIADDMVDPEFGTGAVKITPAHDPADFEAGKRHNLPIITVIDKYGKLTEVAGEFAGMKATEAREKIAQRMQETGMLEKITDYTVRQPISERSGAVIEPMISTQWFMKTTEIKDEATKAVKEGKIKFYPKSLEKTYFHWMENLHDWCISRQLWWGHEIPAWYGPDGEIFVADNQQEAEKLAEKKYGKKVELKQEEDVLDTWFSSGLWPFSTLGWPNEDSKDLLKFFPTTLMETAADIIFFWVARMIMMSLLLRKEVPFKEVYFHGLVMAENGQKMSKSKGNVINPIDMIDKYGSDALRMSLIGGNTMGLPQRFSEQKILKYRNFVTKAWNASRFVALTCEGAKSELPKDLDNTEATFLKKLDELEKNNLKFMKAYQLSMAVEAVYEFFWHEFADQLIEYEKKVISEASEVKRQESAKSFLLYVLERQLNILGDFAPFLVESIRREMLNG